MSKALQKKLNRFVELGNAIEAEAKRLYGPDVFLFHEAEGSVVLMDGDEDDSVRVLALARPCRCGPDSRSDSTSCPRGVMTISVYYFCAEYRDDQLTHSMSGTIQSDMPPFHEDFHARLTERIAANMKPPRPADLVSVRSLSLLATREVEHGDVWARQSGRDDGGHAEHDGTDADAERAYCAAAVGACGRASHE